ncbi:MAG: ribonuclease domain-containing protein [Planctomycetota bacterium]
MSQSNKPSAATLEAIRHLARLGVRGWVLIGLMLGAIYLANKFLPDSDTPAQAASGDVPSVASTEEPDAVGGPANGSSSSADVGADDFGPDPQAPLPTGNAADSSAPPASNGPKRTYPVVRVTYRTRAGEATVDLDPDAVLTRTDGKGLALAERLSGGETLKTNCADDATVKTAKAIRTADIRPPPRCAPLVVEPYLEGITVMNFDRPVRGATEDGVLDVSATLERIALGKKHSHRNDGSVFRNRERRLPRQPEGYYREYVVPTTGVGGPGPQRLVIGKGGDIWYTPDHYDSFRALVQP